MKRIVIGIICIVALLLGLVPTAFAAEKEEAAVDYTKKVTIRLGGEKPDLGDLTDKSVKSRLRIKPGKLLEISWPDEIPVETVCFEWRDLSDCIELCQYDGEGTLLDQQTLERLPDHEITPLPETRKITVSAEVELALGTLRVYGAGSYSDPFHPWQETPEYLDYLLISTHPDDDVLYLGAIVPIYGAEQGYVGTIAYVTHGNNRVRMEEAQNGAWEMGLRYRPLFWEFPDVGMDADQSRKNTFRYDEVLRQTVRIYRQYHPLVVIAQDKDGEYGHWQHILTSKAAVEAFTLAADPAYDPESVEIYGTWQVQKLYLHEYPENQLIPDPNAPLSFFDGDTAFTVAKRAYKKHETQQKLSFKVRRYGDGNHPFNLFGMAAGVVDAGSDLFDNIDETLFANYVEPEPTPTPEPTAEPTPEPTPTAEPTPEPTTEPTPEPTAEPAAEPTAAPTPEPTAVPAAEEPTAAPTEAPAAPASGMNPLLLVMIGGGVLVVILIGALIVVARRNRRA